MPILRDYSKQLGWVVALFAWCFLFYLVGKNFGALEGMAAALSTSQIALSCVSFFIAGQIGAFSWVVLSAGAGNRKIPDMLRAWAAGRLLRYVPGKVWGYWVRARMQKIDFQSSTSLVFQEGFAGLLMASVAVSMAAVVSAHPLMMVFVLCSSALLAAWWCFCGLHKFFGIVVFKPFSSKRWVGSTCMLLPAMLLNGFGIYNFLPEIERVDGAFGDVFLATYVAGVLGQLAVFVPAGLGVREAGMIELLQELGYAAETATFVALASRAFLFAMDFVQFIFVSAVCFFWQWRED